MTTRHRRLIAIWGAFAVLLIAIVALEGHEGHDGHGHGAHGTADERAMFAFTEAELGGLDALHQGKVASLMRDPDGRWFQHGQSHSHGTGAAAPAGDIHQASAEEEARIVEQIQITARMQADRRVPPSQGLAAYGLANPPMVFMFHGRSGNDIDYSKPLSILYVGDLEPTEYAYYARREGDQEISLIPRFQIALLLRLTHGADAAPPLQPKPGTAPADSSSRR